MNFMISKVATSCAVFASVVFGVALTANAANRNWIGGQPDVANTPESPYTIQDLANWDGSGATSSDALFLSVTERTYIQSTNDTVRLGNSFCPNSGEFVFTGSMLNFQLKAGYVADSTVSILKNRAIGHSRLPLVGVRKSALPPIQPSCSRMNLETFM